MQKSENKKYLIIILICILAAIFFVIALFFLNRDKRMGEIEKQEAATESQKKVLTPEEQAEKNARDSLEYYNKREAAMTPEERAKIKAQAEKNAQESLDFYNKREEVK